MKFEKKPVIGAVLAAAMLFSAAGCANTANNTQTKAATETAAAAPETTYLAPAELSNGGLKLKIPENVRPLVLADAPQGGDGVLFSLSEKASVDAAKAQNANGDGAGKLFDVRVVNTKELREMLCNDMSGLQVFAKDKKANHYIFEYPTDVRYVRENNQSMGDENSEDWKQWTMLTEWAASMPKTMLADNADLTAEAYGNSMLDMYLARVAYQEGTKYVLTDPLLGPAELSPNVNPAEYAERLMSGTDVTYEDVDMKEMPDSDYISLSFPDDDVRFDFFVPGLLNQLFGEAEQDSYVRTVWGGGNEMLTKLTFADKKTKSADVVREWYNALTLQTVAGTVTNAIKESGVDKMVTAAILALPENATTSGIEGVWAEKIAGRGMITIEKGKTADTYDVTARWPNSAFEYVAWEMTAKDEGTHLSYENAKRVTVTSQDETHSTEKVDYENGSGLFYINGQELVWKDYMSENEEDSTFIRADAPAGANTGTDANAPAGTNAN